MHDTGRLQKKRRQGACQQAKILLFRRREVSVGSRLRHDDQCAKLTFSSLQMIGDVTRTLPLICGGKSSQWSNTTSYGSVNGILYACTALRARRGGAPHNSTRLAWPSRMLWPWLIDEGVAEGHYCSCLVYGERIQQQQYIYS